MALKPTETPRWAHNGTIPNSSNIVAPSSGERDAGFQAGNPAVSTKVNWLFENIYEWLLYTQGGIFDGPSGFRGTAGSTSLGGSQDNYNPANLGTASALLIGTLTSATLTGLVGGEAGRRILVVNTGLSGIVTLANLSGSSTAGNRFICPGLVDLPLGPQSAAILWYDPVSVNWRVMPLSGSHGIKYQTAGWNNVDGLGGTASYTFTVGSMDMTTNSQIVAFPQLKAGDRVHGLETYSFGDGTTDFILHFYKGFHNRSGAPTPLNTSLTVTNAGASWVARQVNLATPYTLLDNEYVIAAVELSSSVTTLRFSDARVQFDRP
jgi:hypothetical protein